MPSVTSALIVAIDGVPGSGKTLLARQLSQALAEQGHDLVVTVPAPLCDFAQDAERLAHRDGLPTLAVSQTRRIAEAAATYPLVVADTTALTIAVHADADGPGNAVLLGAALATHSPQRQVHLLSSAVDAPGAAPERQSANDDFGFRLRRAYDSFDLHYAVLTGDPAARLATALSAVVHALSQASGGDTDAFGTAGPRWQWQCERCSDADCERHVLLPRPRH